MTAAERFPLAWPVSWRRRNRVEIGRARFNGTAHQTHTHGDGSTSTSSSKRSISIAEATKRLQLELDRLGATAVTLSTNVELRLDGLPRSGQREPDDAGAAVYFSLRGKPVCLACDRWDRVADNVAALAAHIGALRGQERWGVGSVEQAFAGYAALPPPRTPPRGWRDVFGIGNSPSDITRSELLEEVELAFREMARRAHPDAGGTHEQMAELTASRDAARKELSR